MKAPRDAMRVAIRIDKKTKGPILFFRGEDGQLGCYAWVGQHSTASEEYYYNDTRLPFNDKERILGNDLALHYQCLGPEPHPPLKVVTRLPRK
jgi:hypothetical protein